MKNKIEILAPAGTKEAFIGAINAGCQAVYLAGKRFGARSYAANFSNEELTEVVKEAHLNDVKVYVAINTLVYNDEIVDLLEYADFLASIHVDAFLVQDLGIMDLFVRRYPQVEIHSSTQANVHTYEQAKFLTELGVKRVVVARETPISVIKEIKDKLNVEVEAFVQGALCVCYSGNCLMSSMLGGRSGNRGECAQPCRLPYVLYKEDEIVSDETYLLSTKDLMTLEYVGELIEAGVDSLKIEGRMRKPEYVIQSVLAYKKAVTDYYAKKTGDYTEEIQNLRKVFNRDFTKGHMFSEKPKYINQSFRPNHIGVNLGKIVSYTKNQITIKLEDDFNINDGYRVLSKTDSGNIVTRMFYNNELITHASKGMIVTIDHKDKVSINDIVVKTTDHILEKSLRQYLEHKFKTVAITGEVEAYTGKQLKFTIKYKDILIEKQSETVLELALKNPIQKEQIINQFSKTAELPFYFEKLEVKSDETSFISIKEMNDLRRQVLNLLADKMCLRDDVIILENTIKTQGFKEEAFQTVFKASTKKQALELQNENLYDEYTYKDNNSRVKSLRRMNEHDVDIENALIHDVGMFKKRNYTVSSEYMNVTNIYTANLFLRSDVDKVTLSLEMSKERLESFVKDYENEFNEKPNLEVVVYGKPDLMITKYCPIAKTFDTDVNCNLCRKNQYYLKDKSNAKYPLINDGSCNIRVLHSKAINIIDQINTLKEWGISSVRVNLTDETTEEIEELKQLTESTLKRIPIKIDRQKYTYGRYLK